MNKYDWELRMHFYSSDEKAKEILQEIQGTALHTLDKDGQYIRANLSLKKRKGF